MRKLLFTLLIITSILSLETCDLFNPGLGKKVDIKAPLLFVTSHQNGAYVHGTITIAGNFEEDIKTASVALSFNNGITYTNATLDQLAKKWSLGVDTTTIPDGEHDVLFRITDTSNKITDKKLLLYIDNTPPLIIMTTPSTYGASPAYYGSAFYIRGEAADPLGLASVSLQVWDVSGSSKLLEVPATGTNTWAYPLKSDDYIKTVGTLRFVAIAKDRAGNESTKFFHYSDIVKKNGANIAIDETYKYFTGQSGYTSGDLYNFLQNEGKIDKNGIKFPADIPVYFDQDSNKPTIEIYNPDDTGAPNNVFMSTSKLSGKAFDEDSIAANKVEVMIERTTITPGLVQDWITTGNAQAPSVSWSFFLTGPTDYWDADYQITVSAEDKFGNKRVSPPMAFRIDSGAPALEVTQPTQGQYIKGDFTISGTAADAQGVNEVYVSLDNGLNYIKAAGTTSWSFNVTDPNEGPMLIKVKATDNTGKTSTYNLQVIIDKTNPTVNFINPPYSGTVNGLVLIKGTSSDNTQITNAELRIGKDPTWIPMSNYYNWEYEIDSANYANSTFADDIGGGVWKINIHASVTDRAGNVTTKDDFYFLIDNDTDKPVVSILSPQAGAKIGGSTTALGTAIDDDGLYKVYMNLDLDNDEAYTHKYDLNKDSWTDDTPLTTIAGLDIGHPAQLFENEAYWYELSGTTQWSKELNSNGELYNMGGAGLDRGKVTMRVIAVDSKNGGTTPGIKGNIQVRSFRFDDTIPGFENMSHSSNSFVRKSFNLTGRAVDNHQVNKVEISYNGGVNWSTVATPYTTPYNFSILIDTETINNGVFAGSSGILYLRLKATDDNSPDPYTKLELIDLKVDNSYPISPTSTYTGSLSDIHGSGTDSFVQGTATDTGAVSGTQQVEVYFMRGNTVYNPTAYNTTTTLGTVDFSDGSGPVYYTTDSAYKIIIDNKYENGIQDLDGDTFMETFTAQGNNTLWSTQFNSGNIPDGSITIHYVVVDYAQNKHHYQTTGFIKNNKPVISSVTVGTDLDNSGSVETGERFTYSSSFNARNRIYIGIDATDNNPITNFKVYHPNAGGTLELSSATGEIAISGYPEDATTLLCRVTDSDGIVVDRTINVNVDNIDDVAPVVTLSALTQADRTSDPATGGHIELDGESQYDGTDPDVSGTIILRGHVHDNQRVQYFKMVIGINNPQDSDYTTLATWGAPSGGRTDTAGTWGNLTISNVTLSESGGHDFDWAYTWNTANVTNQAGFNIKVTVKAEDFSTNPGTAFRNHDVVPYITGLLRSVGAEGTLRSKYGKFSVREGASETNLIIKGYNLAKTGTYWVRVWNTYTPPAVGAYDEVTSTITAPSPYTSMTLSDLTGITHSGWLRISVNGVEAGNYYNDNSKLYNREVDGSGMIYTSLWTDDRYLHVWQVGASFGTSGQSYNAEYPSMSINSTGTLYGAWMYRTNSAIYYATPGAGRTPVYSCYDPPEYSDIYIDNGNNVNITFLANNYMGNWTDANLGCVAAWTNSSTMPTQTSSTSTNYYQEFEDIFHDQMLLQFQRPKIARYNDNMHVAYYDSDTSSVKYGYVLSTNASGIEITPWINLDGNSDGNDAQILSNALDSTPNRSTSAGEYVAIDVDDQHYPVILYYDIATQTLRLARATSLTPTTAGDWARQEVFQPGDPNKQYSGKYVAMKFDATGNLYVVCYNTANGDLIYIKAPNNAGGGDYTFGTSVAVDINGAVGAWADITLNGDVPYISYLNSSMIGTFSGLKLAYYDAGNWEYETVPLNTAIQDSKTNIEYKKGTTVTWTCAIGYKGTNFDLVYLNPEK